MNTTILKTCVSPGVRLSRFHSGDWTSKNLIRFGSFLVFLVHFESSPPLLCFLFFCSVSFLCGSKCTGCIGLIGICGGERWSWNNNPRAEEVYWGCQIKNQYVKSDRGDDHVKCLMSGLEEAREKEKAKKKNMKKSKIPKSLRSKTVDGSPGF